MYLLMLAAVLAAAPTAADLLPADANGPGCALDVRRGDAPIETAATGLANLEDAARITPDTVFEIGSVSKQFIGAGLAILAQRGSLRLDDPIRRWLPELPPLYDGITISMIAHHTSGIRSWNNLAELTGRGEDSTGYDNRLVLGVLARQRGLNNAPGAEYLYSNSNFVLGALIIERASKQELNAFFSSALFNPLGMTRTRWRTDFREVVMNRAQAYAPNGGSWRLDMPLNNVAGAGGLLSTTGDLQRWATTLLDPRPRDKVWLDLIRTPGSLRDGTALRYGMGIETAAVAGREALSHAGSTGSYRAWFSVFPADRLSVALLCNSGAVNTEDLGPEVAARFLPESKGVNAKPDMVASADLAGVYRNMTNDTAVEATVKKAGLSLSGGPGFGGPDRNRLNTADGQRTLTVQRNGAGKVVGLTVTRIGNAPVTLERVEPWAPARADLRAFLGDYRSGEIDGTQTIALGASGLVWRDPSGAEQRLVPIYRDTFEAPDASWTLHFRRGASQAMSLDMSITRVRRVAFKRVEHGRDKIQ